MGQGWDRGCEEGGDATCVSARCVSATATSARVPHVLPPPSCRPPARPRTPQAMDRVHRLGQTREVRVVRLVCARSVEEKILRMQRRKTELSCRALEGWRAEGAAGWGGGATKAQRLRQLKSLFQ